MNSTIDCEVFKHLTTILSLPVMKLTEEFDSVSNAVLTESAIIHGVVASVSLMKTGKRAKFFEGKLTDGTKTMRMVASEATSKTNWPPTMLILVELSALGHHLEVCASVMGRTKRACHLHLILCTWDALITCTPVTVFFPLGVRLRCSKQQKKRKYPK